MMGRLDGARAAYLGVAMLMSAAIVSAAAPQTDSYIFEPGYGEVRELRLRASAGEWRLQWPKNAAAGWDTALLEVQSAEADERPTLTLSAGGARITQYLDSHARGPRWLNLSPLRGSLGGGSELHIEAHGLTLAGGSATLRLYANSIDLNSRILVIASHPDDAEIAAFGLYADHQAAIVTLTAGNAGDMNYRDQVSDPAQHYQLKGYLRAMDSVTVPWQGGIPPERSINLGYFDGRLDEMYRTPSAAIAEVYGPNTDVAPYRRANLSHWIASNSRSNSWDHLVEDLENLLRQFDPQLIVMPDPRLDTHRDHEFAAVALVQALQRAPSTTVRFLLYTNHADANRYPYGPAGSPVTLLPPKGRVFVQSVFSHATPEDMQRRKLFALESMHDLRLSPQEQMDCGKSDVVRRADYPRSVEEDYFRRAPRANELFLLFDASGARRVVDEFLAHDASELRP